VGGGGGGGGWRWGGGGGVRFGGGGVAAGGGEALEDAALVVEFGGDDAAGDVEGEGGFEDALVVAEAGQAVGFGGGEEAAEEAAGPVEEADGDVGAEEGGQGGGGDLDGLGEDEALDVAEGDFADDFLGAGVGVAGPDFEALGFEVDAGVGQLDAGGGHKQ